MGDWNLGSRILYKKFEEIEPKKLFSYLIAGKLYEVRTSTKCHTLLFKIEEDGKLILVVPFTKRNLRKLKTYLNRIIDL